MARETEVTIAELVEEGSLSAQRGDYLEAIATYKRAIQLQPTYVQAYLALGELLRERGEIAQAIALYRQGMKQNPRNINLYCSCGEALVHLNQLDAAICYYRQALKMLPSYWQAYYLLAMALELQGRDEEAVRALRRAIELNPNCARCRRQLRKILARIASSSKAIGSFSRAFEIKLENETNYHQLGLALRKQGQYQGAIDCYLYALKLNPRFLPAHNALKSLLVKSQRLEELIPAYEKLVQKEADLPIAWLNLADALSQQGQINKAITCYRTSCYQQTIASCSELAALDWKAKKENAPDFIIIGGAKCGTTSLYYYLGKHPQVLLANKKELHFFEDNFAKGPPWYLAHFPSITDLPDFQTGEASPSYLDFPEVPQRIKKLFPSVKLIVLLRNPVERAISWHYHEIGRGVRTKHLQKAIFKEANQIANLTEEELISAGRIPPNNLLGSLYVYKLKRWLTYFKREQLLVLKSEDLYTRTIEVMEEVFAFLDLPDYQLSAYKRYNSGSYPPANQELRIYLEEFFRPHNQKLEEYLEMEFHW